MTTRPSRDRRRTQDSFPASRLTLYRHAIDWDRFEQDYRAPDVFAETIFKWSADRISELPEQPLPFHDDVRLE